MELVRAEARSARSCSKASREQGVVEELPRWNAPRRAGRLPGGGTAPWCTSSEPDVLTQSTATLNTGPPSLSDSDLLTLPILVLCPPNSISHGSTTFVTINYPVSFAGPWGTGGVHHLLHTSELITRAAFTMNLETESEAVKPPYGATIL